MDVLLDGQRLQHDADEGEGHRQGEQGHVVHRSPGRREGLDNPADAPDSIGTVSFQETNAGLLNTDWSSNAPPQAFPILCATLARCGNSLASTYYNVIWGGRVPVLAAPLLKGADVVEHGRRRQRRREHFELPGHRGDHCPRVRPSGQGGDGAARTSRRRERSAIPTAAAYARLVGVRRRAGEGASSSTRAARGAGHDRRAPVDEPDAEGAAAGRRTTSRSKKGLKARYSWTNSKHHEAAVGAGLHGRRGRERLGARVSQERLRADQGRGRVRVHARGPTASRTSGARRRPRSLAKLPPLGPKSLPKTKRRHFFTPFDLMDYGFNPLFPAYPQPSNSWDGEASGRDFQVYGVTGHARGPRRADGEGAGGDVPGARRADDAQRRRATSSAAARARAGSRRTRAS